MSADARATVSRLFVDRAREGFPNGLEFRLDQGYGRGLGGKDALVEFTFVLFEEGFYVGLVNPGRALSLRKGEEKQKYSLDFPIEREPTHEPLADILDTDEYTDGRPIHGEVLHGI